MDDLIRLAFDPGNEKTGWISYKREDDAPGGLVIVEHGNSPNAEIRKMIREIPRNERGFLSIETPKPRGQLTSTEEFETCIAIGRFLQVWAVSRWSYVHRDDVKYHLCRDIGAKDKNVTQALKDRFGGEQHAVGGIKCKNCGGKGWKGKGWLPCPDCEGEGCERCKGKKEVYDRLLCEECEGERWEHPPGPLYGITSHCWQALAVACYFEDNPLLLQAIMFKGDRKEVQKKVGRTGKITVGLRRQLGFAGRNKKRAKK